MTVVSTIIQAAYREGNLIGAGISAPSAAELSEAVDEVNRLIANLLNFQHSANFMDFQASVAATYPVTLTKHTRIVQQGASGIINFPSPPDDGARMALIQGATGSGTLTLSGNGYTIGGSATQTFAAPSTATSWFYRADLGDWRAIATLTSVSDFLFPSDFDDMSVALLMWRLSPRYNKTITQQTANVVINGLTTFTARYFQGARMNIDETNIAGLVGPAALPMPQRAA